MRRDALSFEKQVIGDAIADFAKRQFDMGVLLTRSSGNTEGIIEEWEAALKTKPFLCEQYLVRLDGMQQLKLAGAGGELGRRVWDILREVIENLPDGLHVLMTAISTREGDLNKALLSTLRGLRSLGRVIRQVTYDDWNGAGWVVERAKEKGLDLNPLQADLMISLAGRDMGRLENELEKLVLVAKEGAVDDSLVARSVGGGKEAALFSIAETLSNRDLTSALIELSALLAQGAANALPLVMVLVRFFRQVIMLKDSVSAPPTERARLLGLHPLLLKRLEKQARHFHKNEAERSLLLLYQLEHKAKQSPELAFVLLKNFFQQICQGSLKTSGPVAIS